MNNKGDHSLINAMRISNPQFPFICNDNTMIKMHQSQKPINIQINNLEFSLEDIHPYFEVAKDPLECPLMDCQLYKILKTAAFEEFKKSPYQKPFKKMEGKPRNDELNKIKELWAKEMLNYIAYLYRFNVDKPMQCSGIRIKIKLRQMVKLCKDSVIKIALHCIMLLVNRLKDGIFLYLERYNMNSTRNNKATQINGYNDFMKEIDKLFVAKKNSEIMIDTKNYESIQFIEQLLRNFHMAYKEMNELIDDCQSFYSVLSSHIGLWNYPIAFDDIHWKLFYESIYQDHILNRVLYNCMKCIVKKPDVSKNALNDMEQLCISFYNQSKNWNASVMKMNSASKISFCNLMNISIDYLDSPMNDPMINEFLKFDTLTPYIEIKKKKKKRRKKKKSNEKTQTPIPGETAEEHGEVDDKNSDSDEPIRIEQGEKTLIVPNIPKNKIMLMEQKLLLKMKGKLPS